MTNGDPAAPPARRPYPSKLFVEVTTRCNLRCSMCVKESSGQAIPEGHLTRDTFDRLAPALPHLDALILSGIGEPLLHPDLERFVGIAKQAMPATGWVGFQTNGQLLGPPRARSLVRAGVDRVCISADAVSPEMFRTLRGGGRHDAIELATGSLHDAAREQGRSISIGVEFVAMRDNLHQLPALVRWAARSHVGFVIVTHMLPYAQETRRAAAFETSTDRAREHFREWRERASAAGIDIVRYFDVFMKFRPTPADQRVIAHVKEMVADGWSKNVSVRVEPLLRSDEELERLVREAFAEARDVAAREGVALKLPSVVPTRSRRCDFVEEGGAFVSWKGDVHPCYFLWHGYSCYAGGVAKHVLPKSFGNVADQDILALWNTAPARAFRNEVLRYEFPFCYDCSVALCDYSKAGEFTEDCHLGSVPCGACLWATGVFQCLQ